jgi:hypothetical protein
MGEGNNAIELEAMDHCTEEFKRELIIDAFNGSLVDFKKYLNYPKSEVPDIAADKNHTSGCSSGRKNQYH